MWWLSVLPFRVLILVSIALNALLFDQELHLLVEAGGDCGRLFAQQYVQRVGTGDTHQRLMAVRSRTDKIFARIKCLIRFFSRQLMSVVFCERKPKAP